MSRLIADARRQQAQRGGASGAEAEAEHEPQFNPLAGARHEPPRAPLKRALIVLGYLCLTAILGWQGWQWWQSTQRHNDITPVTVNEPQTNEPQTIAPGDGSPSTPAPGESTEPEAVAETAARTTDTQTADSGPADDRSTPERSATEVPPQSSQSSVSAPSTPATPSVDTTPVDTTSPAPDHEVPASTVDAPMRETDLTAQPAPTPRPETSESPPAVAEANTRVGAEANTPTSTGANEQAIPASDSAGASTTSPPPASTRTPPNSSTTSFSSTQRTQTLASIRDQFQAGETEPALRRAAEHLRRDDHADARQLYARLLLRADQAETARGIVQPNHNVAELELRAYADYQVGAYTDAVRHYNELLRRSSTPQQEWYLWLAICYDNLADVTQASGYYRTYLRQTSGQPDSLIRYARNRLEQLSGG